MNVQIIPKKYELQNKKGEFLSEGVWQSDRALHKPALFTQFDVAEMERPDPTVFFVEVTP